jgi:hypothetical protein
MKKLQSSDSTLPVMSPVVVVIKTHCDGDSQQQYCTGLYWLWRSSYKQNPYFACFKISISYATFIRAESKQMAINVLTNSVPSASHLSTHFHASLGHQVKITKYGVFIYEDWIHHAWNEPMCHSRWKPFKILPSSVTRVLLLCAHAWNDT